MQLHSGKDLKSLKCFSDLDTNTADPASSGYCTFNFPSLLALIEVILKVLTTPTERFPPSDKWQNTYPLQTKCGRCHLFSPFRFSTVKNYETLMQTIPSHWIAGVNKQLSSFLGCYKILFYYVVSPGQCEG